MVSLDHLEKVENGGSTKMKINEDEDHFINEDLYCTSERHQNVFKKRLQSRRTLLSRRTG